MPLTKHFKVTPRGMVLSFPLDMLRYDACWPQTTESASLISMTLTREFSQKDWKELGKPVIELMGISAPTNDRWKSFGWEVII